MRPSKYKNAFTLVELLVVMAVLTVLAAVTIPSVKSLLSDQKVTAAARMVKAHIESARSRAIASNRPVAVILERNGNDANIATSLSIGQVFPPYEGDTVQTEGALIDAAGIDAMGNFSTAIQDGFYDQIAVSGAEASLLVAGVFDVGDFIQIGNNSSLFLIENVLPPAGGVVTVQFRNPAFVTTTLGFDIPTQEKQLPVRRPGVNSNATFRIFRKPTKSFVQTTKLPRGTCVDLTVSGLGKTGSEFSVASASPAVLIVFDPTGNVSYLTTDGLTPSVPTGLIHLMVGRTEQVSRDSPLSIAVEGDTSTFDANLNDEANSWVSINPYTGSVYSSDIQTGGESSTLANRLNIAREFASNGINRSVN